MGLQTRGPPACIMRPVTTSVNCACTVTILQSFRRLGTTLIATFLRAVRKPADNNCRGPLP
jgi:hypothetical protein